MISEHNTEEETPLNTTMTTQEAEDDGFIILGEVSPQRQTEDPPPPKPKVRRCTDDQLSGTCRWTGRTFMAEPIVKNSKETGEWRVYRIRGANEYQYKTGNLVPWDAVLPSKQAVYEWLESLK